MKRFVVLLSLMALMGSVAAQNPQSDYEAWKKQQKEAYDTYKKKTQAEYDDFRKKHNEAYANFIRDNWVNRQIEPAIPVPKRPKPPRPVVAPPDRIPSAEPLPFEEQSLDGLPLRHELPPLPMVDEPDLQPTTIAVNFYGTIVNVEWNSHKSFKLDGFDGESMVKAWRLLSEDKYDVVLRDIIKAAEELKLNDWGVVQLVRKTAERCMGGHCSEAVFLADYLLSQLGAKALMAQDGNNLVLLVALAGDIYNYQYTMVEEDRYYVLDKTTSQSCRVLGQPFPETVLVSIGMEGTPLLKMKQGAKHTFSSKAYPAMKATFAENMNLMDFYNDYPLSAYWDIYSHASLSKEAKAALYPMLKKQIQGKRQETAANMLLNFVQTCFEYATDQDQFGYERPLFADESFHYPYNDCEDRSIVYSILVRDLLGLDVVLLNFPEHLATAVRFTEKVEGDYLDMEDGRYIVCDPTYIGATVGMCMPQYREGDVKLRVVSLK